MPAVRCASLLDDPFFLAELDRVDLPTHVPAWDPGYAVDFEVEEPAATPVRHSNVPDAPPVRDGWGAAGRILLGLAGFLLMMGVGAASAALVFSDRLALILR